MTSNGPASCRLRAVAALAALALLVVTGGCGAHKLGPGAVGKANVPAALPKVGAEAQAEFNEGLRIMKMGRKHYKEARQHFTKATEIDAKLFEAWHDLGVLEAAMGNHESAIQSFRKALDLQPGSRKTVLAYGETLRRARDPKKAAKLYQQWLESDPADADMRGRYGQMLREAGDLESSLEQARTLLANAGENIAKTVIAYNGLGLTYYKMGKLDLADTALRKAVDLDPKSAFVWNNLGLVAFERGHDQEAFLDFQRASELDPKYVQARLNKAVVYLDCGDYKRARQSWNARSRSIPTTPRRRSPWAWRRAATASWIWRGARTSGRWTSSPTTPRSVQPGRAVHGFRQGQAQGQGLPGAVCPGLRSHRPETQRRRGAAAGAEMKKLK